MAIAFAAASALSAKVESSVTSPTSGLTASVDITSKIPYLSVRDANGRQQTKVRLGLSTSIGNFSTGMTFVSATEPETITEQYEAIHGKRSAVSNSANRIEVTLANAQKQLAGQNAKLANENFISRAPEAVVNTEREKKAKLEALIENIKLSLKNL